MLLYPQLALTLVLAPAEVPAPDCPVTDEGAPVLEQTTIDELVRANQQIEEQAFADGARSLVAVAESLPRCTAFHAIRFQKANEALTAFESAAKIADDPRLLLEEASALGQRLVEELETEHDDATRTRLGYRDLLVRLRAIQQALDQLPEPEPEVEPEPEPEPAPPIVEAGPPIEDTTRGRSFVWSTFGVGAALGVAGIVMTGVGASRYNIALSRRDECVWATNGSGVLTDEADTACRNALSSAASLRFAGVTALSAGIGALSLGLVDLAESSRARKIAWKTTLGGGSRSLRGWCYLCGTSGGCLRLLLSP